MPARPRQPPDSDTARRLTPSERCAYRRRKYDTQKLSLYVVAAIDARERPLIAAYYIDTLTILSASSRRAISHADA